MSRVAFALLLLAVIRRGASEEAKWEQNDKDKSGDKAEARFADEFRPHYPGPYGPNSPPIRPSTDDLESTGGLNLFGHRPGRPHYHACRCCFNCPPGLIVVRRPDYYGGVDHLASNNYVRFCDNGGYQFPDYYRAHIGPGLDRQPNGLAAATHRADVAIFARSGNEDSRKDEKAQNNASS